MLNKINSIVFHIAVTVASVLSVSCDPIESVVNGKPTLTVSENPVTVAVNWSKSVTITGGSGSYLIKSISDSSIILASVYIFQNNPKMISIEGKKLGTAKVVVQDSAKTAEVEISVTVAVMVASPSSVTIKVQGRKYVYFQGGTSPYSIDQHANSAIATVNFSGSSIYVEGNAPGSTSVTVKDNASPANTVSIPITVIPKPVFTTAGKISFQSSKGDFVTEGIYSESSPSTVPVNDAGAGGFVSKFSTMGNIGQIIGYKKKTSTTVDIIVLIFLKNSFNAGSVPFDTSSLLEAGREVAGGGFGFDVNIYSESGPVYTLYNGNLIFSTLTEQTAAGSFSGSAYLEQNGIPVPGNNATVNQGTFNVPLIVDDFILTAGTVKQNRILHRLEQLMKPQIEKMKRRLELQQKY